jgi:GT2 family glycosyltransferase
MEAGGVSGAACSMRVSVIIPVFNAAAHVGEAVASAVAQPETGEVILVEDGSTDSSLEVCRRLEQQHDSVRLLRHQDGGNHGAGASRNLGIAGARCPLVAFLDADDYYLPDRFKNAMEVFDRNPDADGVYESTGVFFQDDQSRLRWKDSGWPECLGMRRRVDPSDLFETLVAGGAGSFCTDGLVVRRALFEKSGVFNTRLRAGQDTHLWIRMAHGGRLYPGQTGCAVSMCRIHAGNRVTGRTRKNQQADVQRVWGDLVRWGRAERLPVGQVRLLARRYAAASRGLVMQRRLPGAWGDAVRSCGFLIRHCPRPWHVEGFFDLLVSATLVGLAWRRLADGVVRSVSRRRPGAA